MDRGQEVLSHWVMLISRGALVLSAPSRVSSLQQKTLPEIEFRSDKPSFTKPCNFPEGRIFVFFLKYLRASVKARWGKGQREKQAPH